MSEEEPTREQVVDLLSRYAAAHVADAEDITILFNRGVHASPEMISFDLPVTDPVEFLSSSRG